MMRLLTAAMLLSLAAPAAAQSPPICMPIDELQAALKKHNETPILRALIDSGNVLLIFASPDGSGWTAVVVAPTGAACVGAMGVALKMSKGA
ncbi:MAG: hypothetical protein RLZZ217_919 [Planctomycetota bacterium]|jgi:hypothetical protein